MKLAALLLIPRLLCACGEEEATADSDGTVDASAGGGMPAGGAEAGGEASGGEASGGAAGGTTGGTTGGARTAEPDAALTVANPDLGPEAVDPCPDTCARLTGCATETCGERAVDAEADVQAACLAECGANPSFPALAAERAECPDLLEYGMTAVGEPLSVVCTAVSGPTTHFPVCDIFGERITTCLQTPCPRSVDDFDIFLAGYTYFCDQAATRGDFDPNQLAAFISPATPCDFMVLVDIVADTVAPGGQLHDYCTDGRANDAATCGTGCDRVGPCLETDGPYALARDPGACRFVCAIGAGVEPEAFVCAAALAEGVECDAALMCVE